MITVKYDELLLIYCEFLDIYINIWISGEFVDDYTVRVIDVFAMPQTGTGVSVEAVDPVFQAKMLDMLKQTGRPEMVVGWSVTFIFLKS